MNDAKKIALGVVVMALLVGVGAFLWNTRPDPSFRLVPVKPADIPYVGNADVSFSYPNKYTLNERSDSFEGNDVMVLTLVDPKIKVPDMSEGPESISMLEEANPKAIPLETWVKTKSISNFILQSVPTLASTTVAGEPAVAYTHSGLYETQVIAVAHNGKVFLFSADSVDPASQMSIEFKRMIGSIKFK